MEPLLYLCLSLVLFHLVSSQLAADGPIANYKSPLENFKLSFQVNHLLQQQDGGVLMEGRAPNWNGVFTPSQPVGNISQQCQDDFAQYESDLEQGKMYALLMLDATGKPPSGILQGNVNWLGRWSECLNISTDGSNVTFNAKYYVVYLTFGKPLPYGYYMRHGVCVPSSCSTSDVSSMMNSTIFYRFLFERRLVKAVSAQALENPPMQKTTIAAICICSCLGVLLSVATTYDVLIHQPRIASAKENTEEHTESRNKGDEVTDSPNERTSLIKGASNKPERYERISETGMVGKIFLCFSLYTNIGKLLSTKQAPGSIRCLHGIRFLSMSWVILGHTYEFAEQYFDNTAVALDLEVDFTFQAVRNGLVSVDTFFFLSGFLMSYLLLQQMQKSTENGKRVPFGMMYLHRYLRLTPTYIFALMLYMWVYPYLFRGPMSPYASPDPDCGPNWWTNMLYINNLFPDNMCMIWTWYLANDMQFFVIGVPLVYILFRWRRFGFAMILILLLASFIATAIIALSPNWYEGGLNWSIYYVKPYCRIGPYLVGVAVAWPFFQTKETINKTRTMKLLAAVCWAVATASALAVVYGEYGTYHGTVWTKSVNALYQTVHRTVWGMAVGWVVIACYHGVGGVVNAILSWGFFVPLSRLTYSAYLVHVMVINISYRSRETLVHLTNLTMIYFFLGNLVISYGLAFLVSVAVEAPLMGLEKLIFKK